MVASIDHSETFRVSGLDAMPCTVEGDAAAMQVWERIFRWCGAKEHAGETCGVSWQQVVYQVEFNMQPGSTETNVLGYMVVLTLVSGDDRMVVAKIPSASEDAMTHYEDLTRDGQGVEAVLLIFEDMTETIHFGATSREALETVSVIMRMAASV